MEVAPAGKDYGLYLGTAYYFSDHGRWCLSRYPTDLKKSSDYNIWNDNYMCVPTQALQFQVPDLLKIYNGGDNFPRYFTFRLIESWYHEHRLLLTQINLGIEISVSLCRRLKYVMERRLQNTFQAIAWLKWYF